MIILKEDLFMKEKRYYCDWALSSIDEKSYRLMLRVLLISLVVVTGEIIFKYSLDNNKGKEWATSASMTVTLSKDFEVLSKEPNFSSKEEYAISHKISCYIFIPIFGAFTWCAMAVASLIVMVVAIPISMVHKKMDMKKNLS